MHSRGPARDLRWHSVVPCLTTVCFCAAAVRDSMAGPAYMLVGAQDHIVSCYAAGMAVAVRCPSFGGSAPAAATCCLAGLRCTGSLTLAHEHTSTSCLRDRRLGLLRCPWQALLDLLHVLRFAVSPRLCTARLPFLFRLHLSLGDLSDRPRGAAGSGFGEIYTNWTLLRGPLE